MSANTSTSLSTLDAIREQQRLTAALLEEEERAAEAAKEQQRKFEREIRALLTGGTGNRSSSKPPKSEERKSSSATKSKAKKRKKSESRSNGEKSVGKATPPRVDSVSQASGVSSSNDDSDEDEPLKRHNSQGEPSSAQGSAASRAMRQEENHQTPLQTTPSQQQSGVPLAGTVASASKKLLLSPLVDDEEEQVEEGEVLTEQTSSSPAPRRASDATTQSPGLQRQDTIATADDVTYNDDTTNAADAYDETTNENLTAPDNERGESDEEEEVDELSNGGDEVPQHQRPSPKTQLDEFQLAIREQEAIASAAVDSPSSAMARSLTRGSVGSPAQLLLQDQLEGSGAVLSPREGGGSRRRSSSAAAAEAVAAATAAGTNVVFTSAEAFVELIVGEEDTDDEDSHHAIIDNNGAFVDVQTLLQDEGIGSTTALKSRSTGLPQLEDVGFLLERHHLIKSYDDERLVLEMEESRAWTVLRCELEIQKARVHNVWMTTQRLYHEIALVHAQMWKDAVKWGKLLQREIHDTISFHEQIVGRGGNTAPKRLGGNTALIRGGRGGGGRQRAATTLPSSVAGQQYAPHLHLQRGPMQGSHLPTAPPKQLNNVVSSSSSSGNTQAASNNIRGGIRRSGTIILGATPKHDFTKYLDGGGRSGGGSSSTTSGHAPPTGAVDSHALKPHNETNTDLVVEPTPPSSPNGSTNDDKATRIEISPPKNKTTAAVAEFAASPSINTVSQYVVPESAMKSLNTPERIKLVGRVDVVSSNDVKNDLKEKEETMEVTTKTEGGDFSNNTLPSATASTNDDEVENGVVRAVEIQRPPTPPESWTTGINNIPAPQLYHVPPLPTSAMSQRSTSPRTQLQPHPSAELSFAPPQRHQFTFTTTRTKPSTPTASISVGGSSGIQKELVPYKASAHGAFSPGKLSSSPTSSTSSSIRRSPSTASPPPSSTTNSLNNSVDGMRSSLKDLQAAVRAREADMQRRALARKAREMSVGDSAGNARQYTPRRTGGGSLF